MAAAEGAAAEGAAAEGAAAEGAAAEGAAAEGAAAEGAAAEGAAAEGAAAEGALDSGALEEKIVRVTLWLKKMFGHAPIPEYEVNERTVDILHEVMECNEERDKDVALLIEDMNEQAAKYEAEAQYWQDILKEGLGLSVGSLSKEATPAFEYLVESAMALEVEDTSLTSFYCAINDMTSELWETKSKNEEMERKLKTLTKKLTSALMMEKQLEEDIKKVEESQEAENAQAERRSKNLKFLEDKSKDLKIRIKDAEETLIAAGLDQSLTHEALMTLSAEVAALQKRVLSLQKEVKSYQDLPPSIALAQVKVEEAKRELNSLEEELSRHIETLNFELL